MSIKVIVERKLSTHVSSLCVALLISAHRVRNQNDARNRKVSHEITVLLTVISRLLTSRQRKRMKRRVTFYDPEKDKFITRSPSNRVQYATESHDLGGDGWYMYKLLNKETKVKAKVNAKTSKTKKTKTKKAKSSKSTKKNQRKSKKSRNQRKKSRNQRKK